jgi:hypothetical protein
MSTEHLIQQAIALLQKATRRRPGKGLTYRKPRAFQSYLELHPSVHQSNYPAWRERLIAGPYHPWEYDEFERAVVEQTRAREITLVYTRETVCICRPPLCPPSPESTAPALPAPEASKPSRTAGVTVDDGLAFGTSSSKSTRSATAIRSVTGTGAAGVSQRLPPVQLQLW